MKKNEKSDEKLLEEGRAGIKRAREKLESLVIGLNITFSGWVCVQQAIDGLEEAREKIGSVIKSDLKKGSQEREELIEAIEHARDEIRETMRDLLLAEEGLSEAAFLTRQGKNESYAGASEHVRDAQRACVRLCCASDAWLHRKKDALSKVTLANTLAIALGLCAEKRGIDV